MEDQEIKKTVKEGYGKIATKGGSCCCGGSCCGGGSARRISRDIGYSDAEIAAAPEGADLGLGCGNPTAIAFLTEGETVVDLGSGAGFDCFLAAQKVGPSGKVIGIDMTPEMVEKATNNAKMAGISNIEFRRGEIENLPVETGSADVVISNCAINLSPDKGKVFKEAFRVLKPGGRILISDLVLIRELPDAVRRSVEMYVGCLSGAMMKEKYLEEIRNAGFRDVRVMAEAMYPIEDMANDPTAQLISSNSSIAVQDIQNVGRSVVSVRVRAEKLS